MHHVRSGADKQKFMCGHIDKIVSSVENRQQIWSMIVCWKMDIKYNTFMWNVTSFNYLIWSQWIFIDYLDDQYTKIGLLSFTQLV